uniref:Uncharacterized protein n=1 Tax=Magallana gigas TaxID=29159 RepID=A0A8W8MXB2_MAGGI
MSPNVTFIYLFIDFYRKKGPRRTLYFYRKKGPRRTLGHSVDLEVIEKLVGSLIEYIHQLTSDFSFATKLLHCVNFHVIMFEVKSLSRKVTLNYTFKTTTESHEPGKVYVADVTVTCEKKQLIVKPKDSDDWERFLQDNRENQVRVILIHSKSLRVIEAKLKVYKEYKTVIDSESKNMNVNSEEMRENVARDISSKKNDILKDVLSAIAATDDDLKNVSLKLNTAISELKLNDQIEAVKTWKKREELHGLVSHPSVLKYIAGQKDNNPAIKVYLSHDDTEAMNVFKQIPEITCLEFVNVAEKSKEIFEAEKEHMDYSSILDESRVRTKLGEIINKHAEKLYAKYSSIVGLDAGSMYIEGEMQPCIVIYSLDKDLIPYGEDPLPKTIDGWHCDVREDIVMFGTCFDCRQIFYPNPGCCIGLPSFGIGSAGFLAKLKGSVSPVTGFLTAAHVAAKNWTDLYDFNELLSNLVTGECGDEIVHPLLPGFTDYKIIGKVKESFCGNWGEEGIGMDAAFVQNFQPQDGEYSELQIADESILQFNVSRVMKRGGSTGETEGLLTGNTLSVCVDKDFSFGGFYYFARCFSIESIDRPFFEKGDSGSGVFLMENGKPTKPLGIAFAKLLINHNTAVCRIDKITEAFGLSVCQNEEPMEV